MWSRPAVRRLGAVVAFAAAVLTAVTDSAITDTAVTGTAVTGTAVTGTPAPAGGSVRLDAFTATAHEVAALRGRGVEPVCDLPMARWEPDHPDAGRFPEQVLGPPAGAGTGAGSGARWLRMRAFSQLAPLLADRLRLCREKGFQQVRVGDYPDDPAAGRFAAGVADLARDLGLAVTG